MADLRINLLPEERCFLELIGWRWDEDSFLGRLVRYLLTGQPIDTTDAEFVSYLADVVECAGGSDASAICCYLEASVDI